jgi:DNA-binding MarR family transcriptional regulator
MDYLENGNDSHLVVGSGERKMESGSGPGLITLLSRLSKALNKRTSEAVLGMGWRQFHTLGYLRERASASQQELGEAMLLDDNAVVLLLNELEAAGYSIRRRDPEDRRRHRVEITAAGREAFDRAEKAREGIEDELLGELSREERATLKSLVSRALESLLRVPVEPHS